MRQRHQEEDFKLCEAPGCLKEIHRRRMSQEEFEARRYCNNKACIEFGVVISDRRAVHTEQVPPVKTYSTDNKSGLSKILAMINSGVLKPPQGYRFITGTAIAERI